MNPHEYEALRSLLAQLVEIRGVNKNPEAELLIREAVARQPDATYLLVQQTLLLRAALDEATRTIAALQSPQREESTSDPLGAFGSSPEAIAAAQALERRRLGIAAPPRVRLTQHRDFHPLPRAAERWRVFSARRLQRLPGSQAAHFSSRGSRISSTIVAARYRLTT
jgi:hypothetical protein